MTEAFEHGFSDLNIFSLYCVYNLDNQKIDQRLREFGDFFTVITNQILFEEQMALACEKHDIICAFGAVSYHDLSSSSYHGKKTPFQKPQEFAWQSECRYIFKCKNPPNNTTSHFV